MQDESFSLDEYYAQTNTLFMQGDPAQLEKHHFATVKRLEKAHIDGTPTAASVYNEIACWLRGVSRYDESLEFYRRSLNVIKACGDEHTDMARRVRLNLATLYRLMGDLDEAESLFGQICDELDFETDPYAYVSALNNLSLVYQDKGEFQKALGLYDRVLEFLPQCPNVDEHEIATTYANAASVHMRMGECGKAESLVDRAIALFESMQREDSHLSSAWMMYGTILYMQERFEAARDAFRHALAFNLSYYGRNVDYARISQSLARTFQKLGDTAAAIDSQRVAVETLSNLCGIDDDRVEAYRAYYQSLVEKKASDNHE